MKPKFNVSLSLSPEDALRQAVTYVSEKEGRLVINVDKQLDDADLLACIVNLVKKIIANQGSFNFQIKDFDVREKGDLSTDRRMLLRVLANPSINLCALYQHHEFHPLLNIFLEVFEGHNLLYLDLNAVRYGDVGYGAAVRTDLTTGPAEKLVISLNRAVAAVRHEAKNRNWKGLEKNFRRNASKNARNLIADLKEQLKTHARILIIRIDLSFSNGAGVEMVPQNGRYTAPATEGGRSVYEKVKTLRVAFWKEVAKTYGDGLLGRVSKLEYGYSRGYHLHSLIFLNGAKHQEDIKNGIRIGNIWKRLVPDGDGSFHLCNAYKDRYQYLGIGMASYADDDFFTGFVMLVAYLTKPDFHMQLVLPGRDRALHRTFPPKPPLKKRGRKRGKKAIG